MDLESLAEVETSIAYVGVALKYENMDGGGEVESPRDTRNIYSTL